MFWWALRTTYRRIGSVKCMQKATKWMDSIQQDPVSKSSLWNLISYFKKMTRYFLNVSTFFCLWKDCFHMLYSDKEFKWNYVYINIKWLPLVLTGLNLHSLRNSHNPLNDRINYWLSLVHWKLLFIGTCRAHFGFTEMPSNYKSAVDTRCFWWTENRYLICGKLHRFPHLSCRWLYMDTLKK